LRSVTESISKYCSQLNIDKIPAEVIEKAKICLLDYFGYVLFAEGEEPANILVKTIENFGGNKESTIIGYPKKGSAPWVALVNGAMGHMAELDDTHRRTSSHPGDSVIAAIIAVAEKIDSNGRNILEAMITGYEGGLRIGESVMPSHYHKGWHPGGTINTFGASIAVGKLYDFTAEQMQHCIGTAGAQVSGNFAHLPERAMTKDFNTGRAAMSGVLAAELTKNGFTGPTDFIENKNGFCALYADISNPSAVLEGLYEQFKILEVAHKPYMSCRHAHGSMEGTLEILEQNNLKHNQVKQITARIFKTGARLVDDPKPFDKGLQGARFSAQFLLALILKEGRSALNNLFDSKWVEERLIDDIEIKQLMNKVKIIQDEDLDKFFPLKCVSLVEIETMWGAKFVEKVDYPLGEPEKPLDFDKIREKFIFLTSSKLSQKNQKKVIEAVCNFESLDSVKLLMNILSLI